MSGKAGVNVNLEKGVIEIRFEQPLEVATLTIPVFKRLFAALLTAEGAAAEAAKNGEGRIVRLDG